MVQQIPSTQVIGSGEILGHLRTFRNGSTTIQEPNTFGPVGPPYPNPVGE